MKSIYIILFFISVCVFGQSPVEANYIDKSELHADTFISIDNFGTTYYLANNVFYKKDQHQTTNFSALQLGSLYEADVFNPLKINLFYKDFNTVMILDNRLAEIFKIDFNQITPYKNVSKISTGYDNTIWIFNQDQQKLELFDYKSKTTRAQTVPVQSAVLDLKSNYNYCWLLTKKFLYTYNYFGSLIKKTENTGFTNMVESNENIILKKGNRLFYLNKNSDSINAIETGNLLINDFFVTNESLYIYSNESVYQFKLKTN